MAGHISLPPREHHTNDRLVGGIALIAIGLLALLVNIAQNELLGLLFLPGLGIILLTWGIFIREYGLAVPGCILTGLGLGIVLGVKLSTVEDAAIGGVILLGLAAGFLVLALISPYFKMKVLSWPLIPAGVLALVGILLMFGGVWLDVLNLAGKIWPAILIVVGAVWLYRTRAKTE